jgi:hypothetical protein
MSHENAGIRLQGEVYIRRTNTTTEQPTIGPLPAEYIGATAQANRESVLDPRRVSRGAVLHSVTDPQEPSGKLTLLAVPKKVLAMLFLGTETTIAQSSGSASAEEHLFTADYGVETTYQNISSLIVYPGVAASVDIGVEGSDTGLTFTALAKGTDGNSITITIVDPATASHALTVAVDGTDITVTLATNGSSEEISTAAEVLAAINADPDAGDLVLVTHTGASDGSGTMPAVAETSLTGGSVTGTAYTVDTDYEILDALEGIFRPLSTGSMGASGTCFVNYTYSAVSGTGVKLGGSATIEAKIRFPADNDLADDAGATGSASRLLMDRALLIPAGEINFAGTAPVKAEFDVVPLTPATGNALELQFPVYS